MKKIAIALATVVSFLFVSAAIADTLELADGTLLEGDFVGSSNGIIMFNTGDGIEAFPEAEVVGIFISDGVATRESRQQAEAAPAPQSRPTNVTIPSGTRLVIRTSDSIDSRRHQAGQRFRGQQRPRRTGRGLDATGQQLEARYEQRRRPGFDLLRGVRRREYQPGKHQDQGQSTEAGHPRSDQEIEVGQRRQRRSAVHQPCGLITFGG